MSSTEASSTSSITSGDIAGSSSGETLRKDVGCCGHVCPLVLVTSEPQLCPGLFGNVLAVSLFLQCSERAVKVF